MNKYEKLLEKARALSRYAEICPEKIGLNDCIDCELNCKECWDKALEGIEED